MNAISTTKLTSDVPVRLDNLTKQQLTNYFKNTWEIYEVLFSAIKSDNTLYSSPDPLRNPLIFYLGHTAAFYINKLMLAGLLKEGINPYFEDIFARGVDPDLPENLDVMDIWPKVADVRNYRQQVYEKVIEVINNSPLTLPITDEHPLWALLMALEHDRIHFETSSVLIRQLDTNLVERPASWEYAPSFGQPEANELIKVKGGNVTIGKNQSESIYGWDNEYGNLAVEVAPFAAMKNLVTNHDFIDFVESGGYTQQDLWTTEGWEWKNRVNATYPKFWVSTSSGYQYRAMFDVLDMPLDWPIEINAHEAWAYCKWKGDDWRLMSEAEFHLIGIASLEKDIDPIYENNCNLNVFYGSPSPVGFLKDGNAYGFNDLFGNVWDWLNDDFYALPGFKIHPWYDDFSAPYFDDEHSMLLGGAWATTGTGASKFYRLWFRRHFYQHAGFRLAKSI